MVARAGALTDTPPVTAITCPRCGGTPDPEGGPGRLARCAFCHVLGTIELGGAPPALAADVAVTPGVLPGLLAAERERRGLAAWTIASHELVYVPYWRVDCTVIAHVTGTRQRRTSFIESRRDEHGAREIVRTERDDGPEHVDREVVRATRIFVSACPLDEYGLPTLDRARQRPGDLGLGKLDDGALRVFHPALRDAGRVLDPLVGGAAALDEADAVLAGVRDALTAGLDPGATARSHVLSREPALVYYPVYLCEIAASWARGSAAIDAVSGAIVALRLPPGMEVAGDPGAVGARTGARLAYLAGWLPASFLHLALFPPALFRGPGDLRFRGFVAGCALAGLWLAWRWARRLDGVAEGA